jgi:hypothetical protein
MNLERLFEKLESQEYYSANSKKFIETLKEFTRVLQENFDLIPPQNHADMLTILNHKVIPLVRYVQRSETKEVPWSIIPNFEEIIKKSLGDNYIIIIRPQWHWNYAVLMTSVTTFLKAIIEKYLGDPALLQLNDRIHVISFPILEKTNFLLHTVFAHELGHFYQQKYFDHNLHDQWRRDTLNRLIGVLVSKKQYPQRNDPQILIDAEEVIAIYSGMVREILPDIIGYRLLGHSMALALYHFQHWNNDLEFPRGRTNFYPPLKFRVRTLFSSFVDDEIRKLPPGDTVFLSTLHQFQEDVTAYLADERDLNLLESNILSAEALSMFRADLPGIISFCEGETDTVAYVFDPIEIQTLIDRISDTIPPNELNRKPAKLGDIFLSGWAYYYHLLVSDKEFYENKDDYDTRFRWLSRLLLKAANLTYVHSYYGSQQKSYANAQQI